MRQPLPNIDARVDARRHGSLYVPQRVVQEELVISNMNADRRQACPTSRQGRRFAGFPPLRSGCSRNNEPSHISATRKTMPAL